MVTSSQLVSSLKCRVANWTNITGCPFIIEWITESQRFLSWFIAMFGYLKGIIVYKGFLLLFSFVDNYNRLTWIFIVKDCSELQFFFNILTKKPKISVVVYLVFFVLIMLTVRSLNNCISSSVLHGSLLIFVSLASSFLFTPSCLWMCFFSTNSFQVNIIRF